MANNIIDNAYQAINTINLWYKIRNSEILVLTDIPELLQFRWAFFRDNWDFLRSNYINKINTYIEPVLLQKHIEKFDDFIKIERNRPVKNNPFSDRNKLFEFYAIFDVTGLIDVTLTTNEQQIVNNTLNSIQNLTRSDFVNLRKQIVLARDYVSDIIGLSDSDYNRIYARKSVNKLLSANNQNLNTINEFQLAVKTIDFILANYFFLDIGFIDQFALAKQNANNPEININSYRNGRLDKLHYGETLQQFAARTLGNADNWMEIAIANGLKAPYVDEFGSTIPLLANANKNQINLANKDGAGLPNLDKLYVNQLIYLQSNAQPFPDQRKIVNIKVAPISGEIILELSGDPNLNQYLISDSAHIRIYKPNTTNSSQYILVPSEDTPPDNEVSSDTPWFLQGEPATEKQQKIDLFLSSTGDLQFGSNNDFILSYGIANAAQAIRIKLQTEIGELPRHLDFGLISVQGLSTANITAVQSLLVDSINKLILSDARFDRVERLDVINEETRLSVSMSVRIAGSDQLLPVTFSIPLS